jgi:hypothetical protein
VATVQNPTVDKAILNLKKPLLILDLSIPKMYMLMLRLKVYTYSYGLFVTMTDFRKQKKSYSAGLLSKKSKKSLMFGPKDANCSQFMLERKN